MRLRGIGPWRHRVLHRLLTSSFIACCVICLLCLSITSFSGCLSNKPEPLYGERITIQAEEISTVLDEAEERFTSYYLTNGSSFDSSMEMIPQLMASRLLAELAQSNASLLTCHQENLETIFSQGFVENATYGYLRFQNMSTLGITALFLQTLLCSPFYENSYRMEATALASTLLLLQNDNGSFQRQYPNEDVMASQPLYTEGEVAWAIISLDTYATATGNITYRTAASRSQSCYLKQLTTIANASRTSLIPWYTFSLSAMYWSTGNLSFAVAILPLNDELLPVQDRITGDTLGRFTMDQQPDSTVSSLYDTALCTRAFLHAYQMATLFNDTARQTSFRTAALAGLYYLIQRYYEFSEQPTSAAQDLLMINATRLLELTLMIETFNDALTTFSDTGVFDWEFDYYPELDLVIRRTPPEPDPNDPSKWYALTFGMVLVIIFLFAIYGINRLRRK